MRQSVRFNKRNKQRMKPHLRGIILAITVLVMSLDLQAQHNIKVYIEGLTCNDVVRLAYHKGDQQYLIDTAICENGYFRFYGKDKLVTGNYLVLLPSGLYFNFLASLNEDQTKYIFRTDTNVYADGITVEGSPENKVYLDVRKYEALQNANIDRLNVRLESTEDPKQKSAIKSQINQIEKNIASSKQEVKKKVGDFYVGKLYSAGIRMEIPEAPKGITGEDARIFKYMWIRNHYFDNVDFGEIGLVRSAVYQEVLSEFLDKYLPSNVDTAMFIVDNLIKKVETEGTPELYQFTLNYLIKRFEKSSRMCFDRIGVHIVKEYFCTGKAFWLTESGKKSACNWAAAKAHTQCGAMAHDMNMEDTSLVNKVRLYDIETPVTLVVFWDIDCLHCKLELPILQQIYDTLNHDELTIYTVNINKDFKRWVKVIKDEKYTFTNVSNVSDEDDYNDYYKVTGTPKIYVLNKNKEIEYKDITIWDVPRVVEHMVKQQKE